MNHSVKGTIRKFFNHASIAAVFIGLLAALIRGVAGQEASSRPSFDCKYAKSQAEKLVCSTPDLAALDRRLAGAFTSLSSQGSVDSRSLRKDEDKWLAQVRDACADVPCLKKAYQERIQQLLDKSAKAASPVAYEETRPFPVDGALWSRVQSHIGKSCTLDPKKDFPEFNAEKGFPPLTARNAFVFVHGTQGARFAFLLVTTNNNTSTCRIADAVALPPPSQANVFLQCTIAGLESHGFGMRKAGSKKVVAYWEIDAPNGKLIRQSLGALGAEESIRCNYPETGE